MNTNPAAGEGTGEDHFACGVLRDLPAPLHGFPLADRGHGPDPPYVLRHGGLILQWLLGYNFSVAVWVGYIALFGIAVETGVVMVVYLHEALDKRVASGRPLTRRY